MPRGPRLTERCGSPFVWQEKNWLTEGGGGRVRVLQEIEYFGKRRKIIFQKKPRRKRSDDSESEPEDDSDDEDTSLSDDLDPYSEIKIGSTLPLPLPPPSLHTLLTNSRNPSALRERRGSTVASITVSHLHIPNTQRPPSAIPHQALRGTSSHDKVEEPLDRLSRR